jgi:SAM-dependent methyltransferase
MIVFGTCVGDDIMYGSVARPSIEHVATHDDLIWTRPGDQGIAAAYNEMILAARDLPGCEALVLLHDDVEIVDRNFRPKLLGAVGDGVGVVGVIGASGLREAAWWKGRRRAGAVYETGGVIDFGARCSDVDAVDGLLMALTPASFRNLWFDSERFPAFHGYDVDYCLQARAAGLRVVVTEIDLLHRTKTGYGDEAAFDAAAAGIAEKWPRWVKPLREPGPVRSFANRAGHKLRRLPRAPRRLARLGGQAIRGVVGASRRRGNAPADADRQRVAVKQPMAPAPSSCSCPACGSATALPASVGTQAAIAVCLDCGTGITWPPPARDVEGRGLFDEAYGGQRLAGRQHWLKEARARVGWLQLYLPDGVLLELGPATGEFLVAAAEAGYETFGVEPSSWAAAEARALGAQVTTGYLPDWEKEHPGWVVEIVAMWHVLEHVPQPRELLRGVARVLAPGGHVVIEVPNFDSHGAMSGGANWEFATLDDHWFHYTLDGLTRLLGSGGFEIREGLQLPTRVYESPKKWRKRRNAALLQRAPWPPLDLLRVIAVKTNDPAPSTNSLEASATPDRPV